MQNRKHCNPIHPAQKLPLSLPGCVCLNESRWSSTIDRPNLSPHLNPWCHHPSYQPRFVIIFCQILYFPVLSKNYSLFLESQYMLFLFMFPRLYRACVQRISLCSLLTGALLEAVAALGARSALPYPFPQGSNSHVVLKGRCIEIDALYGSMCKAFKLKNK